MSRFGDSETFALAHPSSPKDVSCWCEPLGDERPDGSFRFSVINGGWRGRFYPTNNELTIEGGTEVAEAMLVWRGEVPPMGKGGYNAAIEWIKGQLNG